MEKAEEWINYAIETRKGVWTLKGANRVIDFYLLVSWRD